MKNMKWLHHEDKIINLDLVKHIWIKWEPDHETNSCYFLTFYFAGEDGGLVDFNFETRKSLTEFLENNVFLSPFLK